MASGLIVGSKKVKITTLLYTPCSDSYSSPSGFRYGYNRKNSDTNTYQFNTWRTSAYTGNVSLGAGSSVYEALDNPSSSLPTMSSAISINAWTYYPITVSSSSGGKVSVSFTGTSTTINAGASHTFDVDGGDTVRLTPTANSGYRFVSWSGVSGTNLEFSASSSGTYSATFAQNPILRVDVSGKGKVSYSGWTSGSRFPPQTEKSVTAIESDSTYRFVRWERNGSAYSADKTISAVVGATDTTYTAVFVSKYHNVSASANGGSGEVELFVDGISSGRGVSVSASNVIEGSTCRVVSYPGTNFQFSSWSVDGISYTSQSVTFIVGDGNSSEIKCESFFSERDKYSFTASKTNPSLGSISLSGEGGDSWAEDDGGVITAELHCGVQYTATAKVSDSSSPSGRRLNEFTGWYKNNVKIGDSEDLPIMQNTKADLSVVAKFSPKDLFEAEIAIPSEGRGSAEIEQEPDSSDGGVDKWLSGTVTVVATPSAGYYVSSFNVTDKGGGQNGFVSTGDRGSDGKYRLSFTLSFNARVNVNFSRLPCSVKCSVDELSDSVSAGVVSSNASSMPVYGDVVTFTASPFSSNGFGFSGWYDENGEPLGQSTVDGVTHSHTEMSYPVRLTGDISVVARFSAMVKLSISSIGYGIVSVDDEESSDVSPNAEKFVEIGKSCAVSVSVAEGKFFNGWYLEDDASYDNPIDIGQEDEIVVMNPVSYVASVISSSDYMYVALCNIDNDSGDGDANLGLLDMSVVSSSSSQIEEIGIQEFMSSSGVPEDAIAGVVRAYRVVGARKCTVNASPAIGRGFYKWTRAYASDPSVETDISAAARFSTIVAKSLVLRAYWGDAKPVRVRTMFAYGNSIVNGNLKVDGVDVADSSVHDRIESEYEVSDMFTQGDVVRVSVDIKNGYLFHGWFYDENCAYAVQNSVVDGITYRSTDASYAFVATAPVTMFAKFVRDRDAIYMWEGSSGRKMATWKSKMYVLPRPDDMSTIRVDADKYPVTARVGEFSSPDSRETSVKEINIDNQNMRRLRTGRRERYIQVSLKSNGAINAAFVGTSSIGVSV